VQPDDRRREAREKIALGSLIVTAGMRDTAKAVLLGGLVELAKQLEEPGERERLRKIGDAAIAQKQT
jgi:hypothetical protein